MGKGAAVSFHAPDEVTAFKHKPVYPFDRLGSLWDGFSLEEGNRHYHSVGVREMTMPYDRCSDLDGKRLRTGAFGIEIDHLMVDRFVLSLSHEYAVRSFSSTTLSMPVATASQVPSHEDEEPQEDDATSDGCDLRAHLPLL